MSEGKGVQLRPQGTEIPRGEMSEIETLRWVMERISVQVEQITGVPEADGFTILRGLLSDMNERLGL